MFPSFPLYLPIFFWFAFPDFLSFFLHFSSPYSSSLFSFSCLFCFGLCYAVERLLLYDRSVCTVKRFTDSFCLWNMLHDMKEKWTEFFAVLYVPLFTFPYVSSAVTERLNCADIALPRSLVLQDSLYLPGRRVSLLSVLGLNETCILVIKQWTIFFKLVKYKTVF